MPDVSIAEAKDQLPRLVHRAEAGETVRIMRRGRPVAVLVSEREFARLSAPRRSFSEFLESWRAEMIAGGIEFAEPGDFEEVRNNAPGREAAWE